MSESNLTEKSVFSLDKIGVPIIPVILIGVAVALLGFGIYQLQDLANQDETVTISTEDFTPESTQSSQQKKVHVDINGAVIKPGVYVLPEGSLIKDVITLAGGWHQDADAMYIAQELNLAELVQDQSKIYIPFKDDNQNRSSSESVLGTTSISSKIKINSATTKELETLEGIGQVRAEKIIENRPYYTLEELVEKKVISSSIFEAIKNDISL